jgi:hypothetical protein
MTNAVIINVLLGATVFTAVVGLLGWAIRTQAADERAREQPHAERHRRDRPAGADQKALCNQATIPAPTGL